MTNQEKIKFMKILVGIMLPKDSIGESLNGGIIYAIQRIQGMKTEESEQQEACGWIPCNERLPECENGCESEAVMYQLKDTESIEVGYFGVNGKLRDKYFRHYRSSTEGVDASDVIAWRPLPEPYKEVQNE